MKTLFTYLLLFCTTFLYGQSFSGSVRNEDSGLPIPFAQLFFTEQNITVQTDEEGKWTLNTISEGNTTVEIRATGYETKTVTVLLSPYETADFVLHKSHRELDKVIVSNNGVLQRESITNVESAQMDELNTIPATTLGEALTNMPGMSQTGIGTGISKPVIRGLSGASVVTYVNQLRIQNQQWGGDHGLPITSIGIGSVEMIKGPASLLYGADALGGVLYFVDEPYAPRNAMQTFVQTRFGLNAMSSSNQAGIKWSGNKLKINAWGGFDSFADYTLPNGNYLINSRFRQASGKLAVGYNLKKWTVNVRYNFFGGRIGLPGHTHDVIIDPASFQTNIQRRRDNSPAQGIQNHFVNVEQKFFLYESTISLSLGHTYNGLEEYEEKLLTPDIIMNLNNTLYNLKWNKQWKNATFILGSQGMNQVNRNGVNAVELLIPNATTQDIGAYGLVTQKWKTWRFQLGGRLDQRMIQTDEGTESKFNDFDKRFSGYSFSSGIAKIEEKSTWRLNVSSGFRAPTTSELLSDGVHHGSFRYEIGNPNLDLEKAVQIDLSAAFHFEDLELIINPFYNRIENYIYIERTGGMVGEFDAFQYQQANFAQLYGMDFGFHYHPHGAHWLHIETSLTNVFAEDENKNPLPLIPQTRINTQLRFQLDMDGKFQVSNLSLQHLYFFTQDRVGELETFAPDYHLINAAVNMKVNWKNPLLISLGVRNALNTAYIDHLSGLKSLGINAPGRNIFLQLKYEFKHKLKSKKIER